MSLQQDILGTGQIPTQPLTNSEGVLILTPSFVVAEAIALVTRQHIGQSSPVAQVEQTSSLHTEESTTHTEQTTTTQAEQATTTRPRPKPRRIQKTRAAPDDDEPPQG